MAITSPQDVRFCNEQVRVAANDLLRAYRRAEIALDAWFANGHNTSITNSATDNDVIDGSAQDGRPIMTGADVHNLVTRLSELVTDMEASGNAKLNTVIACASSDGA